MQTIAPAIAKAATFGGVAAWMVSRNSASRAQVRRLVTNIGSDPDRVDGESYSTLLRRQGHVQGALMMMAHWNLSTLKRDCERIHIPAVYIAGAADKAVPPRISKEAAGRTPQGSYLELEALGHLAHEEAPETVANVIRGEWDRLKVSQ
ncbi:MAG: hypothetical protein WA989_04965, partial [Henriciella sp.]